VVFCIYFALMLNFSMLHYPRRCRQGTFRIVPWDARD
jgi:hypothetical protein